MTIDNDYLYRKRREQMVQTMYDSINRQLKDQFYNDETIRQKMISIENKVLKGKMSAYQAAAELLKSRG